MQVLLTLTKPSRNSAHFLEREGTSFHHGVSSDSCPCYLHVRLQSSRQKTAAEQEDVDTATTSDYTTTQARSRTERQEVPGLTEQCVELIQVFNSLLN